METCQFAQRQCLVLNWLGAHVVGPAFRVLVGLEHHVCTVSVGKGGDLQAINLLR
jgi:hypothetical protein